MKRPFMSGGPRTRTVRALAVAGAALVGAGGLIAVASQAQAAAGCSVSYSVNQWSTGFTANPSTIAKASAKSLVGRNCLAQSVAFSNAIEESTVSPVTTSRGRGPTRVCCAEPAC